MLKKVALILLLSHYSYLSAQYYNKDISASIRINKNSEFIQFVALSENLTDLELALEYEFSIYETNNDETISKNSDRQRYVTRGKEKKLLQTLNLSNSVTNKVVLNLFIYDKDGKPIGKDRVELLNGSQSNIEIQEINLISSAQEEAKPQDGFILEGLLIKKFITKSGKDFYREFYNNYLLKNIKTDKNIYFTEGPVPGRQRSTLITVKVENTLVLQFFTRPNNAFLKEMATAALERVIRQLQNLQSAAEQLKDN